MKKTIALIHPFEQGSYNSPAFLSFARTFKSEFKKELESIGASLHKFNTGHFYISGFFTKGDKFFYFSWHNGDNNLMYRTAKNDKDFTGGANQWAEINSDLGQRISFSINR